MRTKEAVLKEEFEKQFPGESYEDDITDSATDFFQKAMDVHALECLEDYRKRLRDVMKVGKADLEFLQLSDDLSCHGSGRLHQIKEALNLLDSTPLQK